MELTKRVFKHWSSREVVNAPLMKPIFSHLAVTLNR